MAGWRPGAWLRVLNLEDAYAREYRVLEADLDLGSGRMTRALREEGLSFDYKSPMHVSNTGGFSKCGLACRQRLRSYPRNKFLSANRFLRENHL